MASRRDKEKVIDELWDDERIASFLLREPADPDVSVDHFCLLGAYQGMRAGDFRRFLGLFKNAGRDLDAHDDRGRTLADVIAPHRHSGEFLEALAAHGAAAPKAKDAQAPIDAARQET